MNKDGLEECKDCEFWNKTWGCTNLADCPYLEDIKTDEKYDRLREDPPEPG